MVSTNPVGATDNVDEGDDHIRNIKTAVQGSFPNLGAAAVTKTAAEIDDLSTLTGTETLTNKTLTSPTINTGTLTSPKIDEIHDSNGNEVIILSGTASAVNEVTITNKATGGNPSIEASGEANRDLNFARNGTGDITVDAVPIYGMIVLEAPESLTTATTGGWVSSGTFASTTLVTAGAVIAVVRIRSIATDGSAAAIVEAHVRKSGSGLVPAPANSIGSAYGYDGSAGRAQFQSEGLVALDSNSEFDYQIIVGAGDTLSSNSVTLVGYYV